jgi:hypothetical protein
MKRIHIEGDNSFEKDNSGVTEGMGKCDICNHLEMMDIRGKLVVQTC